MTQTAWGAGLATFDDASGEPLDTFFPSPDLGPGPPGVSGTATLDADAARTLGLGELTAATGRDPVRGTRTELVATLITDLKQPPEDAHDVYLRLHLLSHRLATPNSINLDGVFGLLPNIAWTSLGAVAIDALADTRLRARVAGIHLEVISVDKFPRMTDYVVPGGVRIADADRVRLGAHLAEGTTVMHEGFVNFNAGTLGSSMVEGRISQGVVVGDGTDVGGGASIMGTLSGGGTEQVTVGERCLLGANSGIGISLGDDCVVEAGLYITAGTLVRLPDGAVVKGRDISGIANMLFIRHGQTGAIEARQRSGSWDGLNQTLHANE